MDCKYYDNDEVMAQLGRQVVDQYIGFCEKEDGEQWTEDVSGPGSYIIAEIGRYVRAED